jgi:hypothetical protein
MVPQKDTLNIFMYSSAILKLSTVLSVKECELLLNQLFSGAHVAVFATNGTPYHRMVVNFENAGFEIRDQIVWVRDPHVQIALARKPLEEATVAANVLKFGTGGLNVDAGRIATEQSTHTTARNVTITGRFPANVIMTKAAGARLDKQSGILKSEFFSGHRNEPKTKNTFGAFEVRDEKAGRPANHGGASRFFKCCDSEQELIEYLTVLIS